MKEDERILNAIKPIVNARKTHKDDNLYSLQLNSFQLDMLQDLLDLYTKEKLNTLNLSEQLNKEKEKNKKIEDKIKRKIEWYQQYCDLDDQTIRALEDILE